MEQTLKFSSDKFDPLLLQSFLIYAEQDLILQKIIQKSENTEQFTNYLISGILCLLDRENKNNEMIKKILESNPQLKKLIEEKNDTLIPL